MIIFTLIAFVSVALAGLISAFMARRPDRFTMWLVAYLIIIPGLVQYGLVSGYELLDFPVDIYAILSLALYNIGTLLLCLVAGSKGVIHVHASLFTLVARYWLYR